MMASMQEITGVVAQNYGVSVEDIRGQSRLAKIVLPRHVAMYLCHKVSGRSQKQIAGFFHRDHTSVGHALGRVKTLAARDADVHDRVGRLMDEMDLRSKPRFYRHGTLMFRSQRPEMERKKRLTEAGKAKAGVV